MFSKQNSDPIANRDMSEGKVSEGVSVGKDNDGYIATMSFETCLAIPKVANKVFNSKTDIGHQQMMEATILLMVFLYKQKPDSIRNIDCPELNSLDYDNRDIDPYELKKIMRSCIENNFNIENFGTGKAYDLFLAFKINTPRKSQEPLSPQWEAVTNKYNLPTQFAMNYRDTCKEEGNVIGFRLDEKINPLVKRPSACKPGYILFKVSNWEPVQDKILEDQQHFGKTNLDGIIVPGVHTKQTEHPEYYKHLISKQPIYYTLQEVLAGVEKKKFVIDEKLSNNERISFTPVPGAYNNPKNSNAVFSFDMTSNYNKPIQPSVLATISNTEHCKIALNSSSSAIKWNNNWGTIENALQREYKLQSDVTGGGNKFKDVIEIVIPLDKQRKKSHMFNPVQHSFECYNPGIQSNINAPAIFVDSSGTPSVKNDFKGHVKYLGNYCQNQIMHINPHWDMKMNSAGQLVLAQIHLANQYNKLDNVKIPIESSTMVSFIKCLQAQKFIIDETNFQQLKNAVIFSGQEGLEPRIQLCNYLVWQINEKGQLPYDRESINELTAAIEADSRIWMLGEPNLAAKAIESLIEAGKLQKNKQIQISSESNDIQNKDASNVNYSPPRYNGL